MVIPESLIGLIVGGLIAGVVSLAATSILGRARQQAAMVAPTIKKLRGSGVTTLQRIAAELNKQGIPSPSGTGQWQPEQVRTRAVSTSFRIAQLRLIQPRL
jgi:hypothetical protein